LQDGVRGAAPEGTAAGQPQRFEDVYPGECASVFALTSIMSGR